MTLSHGQVCYLELPAADPEPPADPQEPVEPV